MSSAPAVDVCVVGGGPAGSMTAWALARRGVRVTLLDRALFPRDKPCAEYLSPEASRLLSEMGVLGAVEKSGASRLAGMRVRSPAGDWLHGEFAAKHGFRGFRDEGLAIRRTVLDAILLEAARAAGATVLEGVQVVDLTRDDRGRVSGVVARTAATERMELAARFVIGADGLRSVVARRMGVARRARWPARVALVTHYTGIADVGDCGEMHVERDGYLGLARVDGVTNVALVVPVRAARKIAGAPTSYMEQWIAARSHLRARFAGAERVTPVRATGPFAGNVTSAWKPGAAVVGDAADFFDPFTGEGIFAALRGAELLAPLVAGALDAGSTEARAARAYDAAREREFAGKWALERVVALAVARPYVMNRVVRSLARRKDIADLLVGACGDFVPPRELLRARVILPLIFGRNGRTEP